jgi:hypothetical protein
LAQQSRVPIVPGLVLFGRGRLCRVVGHRQRYNRAKTGNEITPGGRLRT